MSNIISFDGKTGPGLDLLQMSNSGTDVFINILALSGSALARTESEKRLVVYLSEKDQTTGRGCVGFDIIDMPWDKETFAKDKEFVIRIIDRARNGADWKSLDYSPDRKIISYYLDIFEGLINRMTADEIRAASLCHWLSESDANDPIHCGFPRCEKHNTLLTCFGCQICNSSLKRYK